MQPTSHAAYQPPPKGFGFLVQQHQQEQKLQQKLLEMHSRSVATCIVEEKLGLL